MAVTKHDEEQEEKTWRMLKNVVVISLAFMLHFTAYSGAANLQSSINAEAGLGTASLAAVYVGLVLSNLFLPVVVIRWLGCKWAMAVSFFAYMPYIAAQMYPKFWTLIPAGLLVGFGGGPLWCAKCTYLSSISETHSKKSGISAEALLSRFLGMFFMIFQLNQVWGNMISSIVLSTNNEAASTAVNVSLIPQVCGAHFVPGTDAADAFQTQPLEKIQMMAGIYLACMLLASFLLAVGVDSVKRYQQDKKNSVESLSGMRLLIVTVQLLMEPKQLLLVTINIFIGMQEAFFGADFTAAFVSCAIGTGSVGFVMMTFGLADAIGCFLTGYIAKVTGRLPLICSAAIIHTGLLLTLLLWPPQASQSYIIYIIAVLWGFSDSIWIVQINAYYGILFKDREEAAFSNFRLWESVGFIIAYAISSSLRTSLKTIVLLVLLYVGILSYFIVEFMEFKRKKAHNKELQGTVNVMFTE